MSNGWRFPRVRARVSCVACGEPFTSEHNLRAHLLGGWQPLWWRALQKRKSHVRR